MAKKRPKYNQNSAIRGALRRCFVRSPAIQEIMKANRREEMELKKDGSISKKKAVYFKCNKCGKWERRKNVSVDHIIPVIPTNSVFTTWDDFINRLFCDISNLQILCKSCHDEKTKKERDQRKKILTKK